MARATNNPFIRDFSSFRLLRGSIARAASGVCSHETYFDVALCWFTSRIDAVLLPLQDHLANRLLLQSTIPEVPELRKGSTVFFEIFVTTC
jgi:hypothetical protein